MDEGVRKADAESERINIPAIPNHYWRYRMHMTLEELLGMEALNGRIAEMIRNNRR